MSETKLNKDQISRCEIFKKYFTPRSLIELYVTAESNYGQKAVGGALDDYPFVTREGNVK